MTVSRRVCEAVVVCSLLAGCGQPARTAVPAAPVAGMPSGTGGQPWWNDTVFYEIFVRSFYDGDGDGIGDLNGLIQKLDYLNDGDPATDADLGVTGIWLMPIHPAASYHGYDVTDFYTINPDYGTPQDFKRLMSEAHRRGVRVIIDLVLNHTSDQHPWFQKSRDGDPAYRDWYVWSESEQAGAWHRAASGDYYFGLFWEHMPDLNYTHPDVTSEMEEVTRFWLDEMGVDGFRVDGAKHLVEYGAAVENTQETHDWYKGFRTFYKEVAPEALTVGEVWSSTPAVARYLQGDEFDLAFDFDLARAMILGAGVGNGTQIRQTLASDLNQFAPNQFATFLTNHDQDRAMSTVGDRLPNARVAAAMLLTAPGVPFLYYGEEIGMLGAKPDEDIRLPMQWSSETGGGFTTGSPWRGLNKDWEVKNVAAQTGDANSLLSWYRTLIRIRRDHAALRVGDTYVIDGGQPSVYAVLRVSPEESVLVVVNLGKTAVSDYGLGLAEGPLSGAYAAVPIWGEAKVESPVVNGQGGFEGYKPLDTLPAHHTLILQLQR
jgi:alpha-amylase